MESFVFVITSIQFNPSGRIMTRVFYCILPESMVILTPYLDIVDTAPGPRLRHLVIHVPPAGGEALLGGLLLGWDLHLNRVPAVAKMIRW